MGRIVNNLKNFINRDSENAKSIASIIELAQTSNFPSKVTVERRDRNCEVSYVTNGVYRLTNYSFRFGSKIYEKILREVVKKFKDDSTDFVLVETEDGIESGIFTIGNRIAASFLADNVSDQSWMLYDTGYAIKKRNNYL